VAKEVSKKKPIVVYKVGRTERAARASMSHTGFFGGSYGVAKGAFKQAGLIEVDSYEELRATCRVTSMQPPAPGPRVGMISNGGGVLVQGIDLLKDYGLEIPDLSPESIERLHDAYPSFYLSQNPVDLTGSATSSNYEVGIEIMMEDPNIDIVMPWFVFQTPSLGDDIVQRLGRLNRKYDKPMVLGTTGGVVAATRTRAIVELGIPIFHSVREWVAAARGSMRGKRWEQ
jgi:3-hydroxypropionyl-CoA synthetase (ADP-forming)